MVLSMSLFVKKHLNYNVQMSHMLTNDVMCVVDLYVQVKKCQSQSSQAQPCLVCGDAVLRIWSFMTGPGDKYLRITNQDNANDKIVDCGGDLENNNFTSK